MRKIMEDMIRGLEEKIRANLNVIYENQKDLRKLYKEPLSEARNSRMEEKNASNKVLLDENNDFINIKLTLISFLEKYNDATFEKNDKKTIHFENEEECFELTVENKIPYDQDHPFYTDEAFFQRLLEFYQNQEKYEECSKLMNSRKVMG